MANAAATDASKRRDAILVAAGRLFITNGLDATTTADIARAAGVSKRDLYAAFPAKDLILSAVIASSVDKFSVPVTFAAPTSRTQVLATLDGFARGFLRFLLSPEVTSLYRIAIATAERHPAAGQSLMTAGVAGTVDRLTTLVRAAAVSEYLDLPAEAAEEAVLLFLSRAIGRLQMQGLLDPSFRASDAAIAANARRAVEAVLHLERPRMRP